MRNPEEEVRAKLLSEGGRECPQKECAVIVQRTQHGTLADGMRAHQLIVHPETIRGTR